MFPVGWNNIYTMLGMTVIHIMRFVVSCKT